MNDKFLTPPLFLFLDPSVLDKLTQIPENLPMWKKSILMLRNQKIIVRNLMFGYIS